MWLAWHILKDLRSQIERYLPSGMDVSRETFDKLVVLYEWHQKCRSYSSFARYRGESEFWDRHVGNSLRLIPYLASSDIVLDVGSGGGFPGLVLAAFGQQIILSEKDRKKRFFLKEALRLMNLKADVIDDSRLCESHFTVVTARAVSSLKNLLSLVPNVSRETRGLFLKGVNFKEEIGEASKKVADFSYKVHHYSEGVVLEVVWKTL